MRFRYLIAILLSLCLLTACGKKAAPPDNADETEEIQTEDGMSSDVEIEAPNDDDPDNVTGGRGMWKYVRTKDQAGNLVYTFDGLVVTLPANWDGKYDVAFSDSGEYFTFYHTDSIRRWQSDYGLAAGRLITVGYRPDDSYTELPSYEYIGPGPGGGAFFFEFPTDVQGFYEDAELMEAFNELAEGYDFIIENSYSTAE